MRPIFNKKVTKKYNLWNREQYTYVLFTVDKVNYCRLEKKKKKEKNVEIKRKREFHCKSNCDYMYGSHSKSIISA